MAKTPRPPPAIPPMRPPPPPPPPAAAAGVAAGGGGGEKDAPAAGAAATAMVGTDSTVKPDLQHKQRGIARASGATSAVVRASRRPAAADQQRPAELSMIQYHTPPTLQLSCGSAVPTDTHTHAPENRL